MTTVFTCVIENAVSFKILFIIKTCVESMNIGAQIDFLLCEKSMSVFNSAQRIVVNSKADHSRASV